jgi:hypothetical protein
VSIAAGLKLRWIGALLLLGFLVRGTGHAACVGDCDGDGAVTIDESLNDAPGFTLTNVRAAAGVGTSSGQNGSAVRRER